MAKLKLYTVSFYEDVNDRGGFLRIDGDETDAWELTDEIIPLVKFFADKKEAEKECAKQNKEIQKCGLNEEAVVEEFIFNIKPKKKGK